MEVLQEGLKERKGAWIYRVLGTLTALCFAYFTLAAGALLISKNYIGWFLSNNTWLVCLLLAAAAAFLAVLLYQRLRTASPLLLAASVFLVALLPRLALSLWIEYIPASDFRNYYQIGLYFASGDFDKIAAVAEGYNISAFTGLSVLNGLIAFVTKSVRGFQCVQACMTAFHAVLIYLIGRRMDHRAGVLAALAYGLYPANIFMTQVITNQHWSVLFGLLGVLCLAEAARSETLKRALSLAGATGAILAVGQFAHPSTPPVIIAYTAFLVVLCLRAREDRPRLLKTGLATAVFIIALAAVNTGSYAALQKAGLYRPENYSGKSTMVMSKILFGTNPESMGSISYEDASALGNLPEEERLGYFLSVIAERVGDVKTFVKGLMLRPVYMWSVKDSAFDCYLHGLYIWGLDRPYGDEPYDGRGLSYAGLYDFTKAEAFIDFLFVSGVYMFAAMGTFLSRKKDAASPNALMVWIVLGWISVHELIEIQARYRYYAMPYAILLAALGFLALSDRIQRQKSVGL